MVTTNAPPQSLSISARASAVLSSWLDLLTRGMLELHQLPAPVRAFYLMGDAFARAELEPQLRAATADADRYYIATLRAKATPDQLTEHEAQMLEAVEERGDLRTEGDALRVILEAAQTPPHALAALTAPDARPAPWEVQE